MSWKVLLGCALLTSTLGVSCDSRKKGSDRVVYIPGENTSIQLTLASPENGQFLSFADVCGSAGAESLLITIDAAEGSVVLLSSLDGATLYNCSGPCAPAQPIEGTISAPTRVRVEGLSIDGLDYPTASSFDVVCRGVADVSVGMGSITAVPSETPSASPVPTEPENPTTSVISATVPMFRIGDFNGTFDTGARPVGRNLAASALVPREILTGRAPSGGRVVVAGGLISGSPVSAIYEFDPRSVAFTTAGSLRSARHGLSSTAIADSAGNPVVLLAGGSTTLGEFDATTDADLYRSGLPPQPLSMRVPRAFHSATYVHTRSDSPVVAIIGGCNGGGGAPTAAADYEYFYGDLPAVTPPNCATNPGEVEFCRPNLGASGVMGGGTPEGKCLHSAGLYTEGTDPVIWAATGKTNDTTLRTSGFRFNANAGGAFTSAGSTNLPAVAAASFAVSPNKIMLFGGHSDAANAALDTWTEYRFTVMAEITDQGQTLNRARGFATVSVLLDQTAVVTGGKDAATVATGGLPSAEFFIPVAASMTNGSFVFLSRTGGTCTDGTEAGCVQMQAPRYGHRSVVIEGSSTWLNGALVVVGGNADPEIFIPAYACTPGTETPETVLGNSLAGVVDFCDRGRPIVEPSQFTSGP